LSAARGSRRGAEWTLSSLYWQQSFADKKVHVRAGKYLTAMFFDTNTVACDCFSGFMSQNFNQSIANPMPN